MSYRPHYIASYENDSGLNTYYEPFLIPEKAFPIIEDAFVWRGRVKRRPGYKLIGRLRRTQTFTLPAADGTGTYTKLDVLSSIRGAQPYAQLQPNFQTITIDLGGPDVSIYKDDGLGAITYVSGTYTITSGTINYITGKLVLNFSVNPPAATTVQIASFYFPTLPVMGLLTRETPATNDEIMFAFDTVYAYTYNYSTLLFEEVASSAPTTWTGTDSDFFWGTNYWNLTATNTRLFWVTNNVDRIRYYNDTAWVTPDLYTTSAASANYQIRSALLIVAYKNRLLFLNTKETEAGVSINYNQRIRWSQIGDPTASDAWYSDVVGKGGFIDIPTSENIVSCEFVKDVLLIKCERSSWKLTYLGNPNFPFAPERVNSELGCESTFSLVPFDRGVFAVSNFGITTDDSVNVSRIDQVIPRSVFQVSTDDNGLKRIHGVRDYYQEVVYWTYPSIEYNPIFPNQLFVYNYVNQTWAIWNDSYTCFGYFQYQDDLTWAKLPYETWTEWTDPWNSATGEALFPYVSAGNNQGFIVRMEDGLKNDPFLQINSFNLATDPTHITVYQHNLGQSAINPKYSFVIVNGILGDSQYTALNGNTYLANVVDANTITLEDALGNDVYITAGTYLGGGTLQPLNNINVWTKVFAPFYDQGNQARVGYIDYLLDKTDKGQISVDFYIDENNSIPINDPDTYSNKGLLGSATVSTAPANANLIPWQATQNKIWQRQFVQAVCQNFQIQIYMSDKQMFDADIQPSEINMHAMAIYLNATARMTQ